MPSIRRVKEWYAQSFEASMVTGRHCRPSILISMTHHSRTSGDVRPMSDRVPWHRSFHSRVCWRREPTSFPDQPNPSAFYFTTSPGHFCPSFCLGQSPSAYHSITEVSSPSPKGTRFLFYRFSTTFSHPFLSSSHLDPFRTASLTFAFFHSPNRN
jgi:hypothetical protein